jgi:hypothetical protein
MNRSSLQHFGCVAFAFLLVIAALVAILNQFVQPAETPGPALVRITTLAEGVEFQPAPAEISQEVIQNRKFILTGIEWTWIAVGIAFAVVLSTQFVLSLSNNR